MQTKTLDKQIFAAFPKVETQRFYLDAFDPEDPADIMAMYRLRSDPAVIQYMDRDPYTSLDEAKEYLHNLAKWFTETESIAWAIRIKEGREAIGFFTFWNIRYAHCRAEIGYGLLEAYWQQGIISEVMPVMLRFGFDRLQLHSIDATTNPENKASKAALVKFGFKQEGLRRQDYQFNGRFLDSMVFGLLREDLVG